MLKQKIKDTNVEYKKGDIFKSHHETLEMLQKIEGKDYSESIARTKKNIEKFSNGPQD